MRCDTAENHLKPAPKRDVRWRMRRFTYQLGEHGVAGATLVRPDGYIARRSESADMPQALQEALRQVASLR